MRKSLMILALGALVWLAGSTANTRTVDVKGTSLGTNGLEEALFRFGVPLADLPGPDVSDLPEQYQQMVHRLLSVPRSERPPMDACFYPGTDPKIVERVTQALAAQSQNPLDYYLGTRWSTTANGSTGSQGNPIIITYSFVPDGVSISGGSGEPTSNNVLYATMNSLFGSETVWKAKFAQCFARWHALAGVTYQEVSDDGAAFPDQPAYWAAAVTCGSRLIPLMAYTTFWLTPITRTLVTACSTVQNRGRVLPVTIFSSAIFSRMSTGTDWALTTFVPLVKRSSWSLIIPRLSTDRSTTIFAPHRDITVIASKKTKRAQPRQILAVSATARPT